MGMKASVVIPAHNEAIVLPRLLRTLEPHALRGELELVVACNGCTDETAAVAREIAPSATVIEVETASKTAALRAADAVATAFPRFYVDADVRIAAAGILLLSDRLGAELLAVAPSVRYDVSNASRLVRRRMAVFELLEPHHGGIHGTGVMGVSERGRARFGTWPEVIADDYFLDGLFTDNEKARDHDVEVTVTAPVGLRDLVARQTRVLRANADARARGLRPGGHQVQRLGPLIRSHPRRAADIGLYAAVALWCRLAAALARRRGTMPTFVRDSSRKAPHE
jgi:glycosyltransferase involved in cell wall biosynthesis